MTHLQPGALLQGGKYRIEKFLGQGGFGITYLGWHVSLNSRVAVKEFFMKDHCDRNPGTHQVTMGTSGSRELVLRFREKFIKEARHIYALSHPHIVRVIDVFEENGTAYYVMDYLGGGTLQDAVQAHGALSVSVASGYIRQVASALDHIHGRNLLHLDVKPSNIMLNDSGEAILVDFGVSKRYDESGHQTSSTPLGVSEGYAPIEQYESGGMDQFSPSTDIYSLGATFYYLLTGSRPPKASALLSESLSFPDGIPEGIRACIVRSMAPGRKDRPQNVDEFLYLLETAVGGSGRKSVKDEETVPDAVVVELEVSKPGKISDSGKVSVSGRMSLRKWLVPIVVCLLAGWGVYLFWGGKTDNSGTLNGTLTVFSDTLSVDSIQQEEANRQNEILAQNKRIQEKEYRDNLVEEIDTVYNQVNKPIGGGMLAIRYMMIARKKNKPIVENLISRVKSDTLWMNVDTRNKYRFIRKKYQQYLNQEYAEVRMWQEPIEKNIIKLYDKLPQTPSSFVYSTQEEILRVKVGCDDVIKDVNGDTSWMKEEFKVKYNHIVKCINAWNKSLEKASDTIKKDIDIKEQEVIEKIHQESIPKFGLG